MGCARGRLPACTWQRFLVVHAEAAAGLQLRRARPYGRAGAADREAEKLIVGRLSRRQAQAWLSDARRRPRRHPVPSAAGFQNSIAIMVDYNQALTVSPRRSSAAAPSPKEGVYSIEEPIRHDDVRGLRRSPSEYALPLQIGENFNGAEGPWRRRSTPARATTSCPMPERIGGVTGWMQSRRRYAASRGTCPCRRTSCRKSARICWRQRPPRIGSNMWIGPTRFVAGAAAHRRRLGHSA